MFLFLALFMRFRIMKVQHSDTIIKVDIALFATVSFLMKVNELHTLFRFDMNEKLQPIVYI